MKMELDQMGGVYIWLTSSKCPLKSVTYIFGAWFSSSVKWVKCFVRNVPSWTPVPLCSIEPSTATQQLWFTDMFSKIWEHNNKIKDVINEDVIKGYSYSFSWGEIGSRKSAGMKRSGLKSFSCYA